MMDARLEADLMHEANIVLLERNRKLAEALGAMLAPDPSPDDRQRAIAVWRKECGVPE